MTDSLKPRTALTERFIAAASYATALHSGQVRKSTDIPYICHPLGVASLIIEAGGDEDHAIGGLLHDIAEDCGGEARLVEIKAMFGDRVEAIVRGCSDSLTESEADKAPWRERKVQHLAHLRTASFDVLIVSAADKLHNARAISTDHQIVGAKVWERFNADRDSILWYYTEMLSIFIAQEVPLSLSKPLSLAVQQMAS